MQRIVVINSKGGCGKTTISTNLASFYAGKGINTALFDYDSQGSSMRWMSLRANKQPTIYGIDACQGAVKGVTSSWHMRVPPEIERLIVDTPPGLKGIDLIDQLKGASCIVIPVVPSSIDVYATADFIRDLMLKAKVQLQNTRLAIVTNRTRKNTKAFQALQRFLHSLSIPVIANLRDTQNYVAASEEGLGVHEIKNRSTYLDLMHWRGIYNWLEGIRE
jgi:chromosome partitioning protein